MDTAFLKVDPNNRKWHLIDAEGVPVGRLAARAAGILMGKNKPIWSPHIDCGDHVIVVNASKAYVTGKKFTDKIYYSYSGYNGGLKEVPFRRLRLRHPERIIEKAIWGMLPKNKLGRQIYRKLKVYAGAEHPHGAQTPQTVTF
ncbi:MAG TPA: 50S ribosomal protein L13 [Caldisericia bacterium]|nr:50S ribosomal protein L13 [Caldisericia bacterium]HPF49316.1 50S ribosomal protein L13 [Caldisericia bacterium]HPI84004.1 50S ribosomal protein L13 [Caldisericia bacterium]HPQ93262.1 50S ribosomal protein L13 [Caldisericia bacterium]HRV75356.1 50S ribosomal protein L13 [Caldisericia bacterium]